jgi:periplasmic copper chaperone A
VIDNFFLLYTTSMNRTFRLNDWLAVALLFFSASAAAQVNVNLPWIRATTHKSAAVYLQLEAHAAGGVALTGATSAIAKSVKIVAVPPAPHGSPAKLDVAAGASLVLKPGGPHLLLVGVQQRLKRGGHVPLTLTFEPAGAPPLTVDISAEVVGPHDMSAVDHEKEHHHEHPD